MRPTILGLKALNSRQLSPNQEHHIADKKNWRPCAGLMLELVVRHGLDLAPNRTDPVAGN